PRPGHRMVVRVTAPSSPGRSYRCRTRHCRRSPLAGHPGHGSRHQTRPIPGGRSRELWLADPSEKTFVGARPSTVDERLISADTLCSELIDGFSLAMARILLAAYPASCSASV